MWIFTTTGFFSAVLDLTDDTGSTMMVRARWRGDLERLQEFATFDGRGIVETPDADYRFRAFMKTAHWIGALEELGRRIDYGNFKDAVAKTDGPRARAYLSVWSAAAMAAGRQR
jgi:hypothetical protein